MNISDEAVEAAAREIYRVAAVFAYEPDTWGQLSDGQRHAWTEDAKRILEATAPILLSHERQQTADAHRDAIVNRDTVDRLERELQTAKADAWDEGRESVDFDSCGLNPYRSQA